MGKYISGGDGSGINAPIAAGCDQFRGSGAHAYDAAVDECLGVTGIRIPIGDTDASIQKGFEIFNRNINQDRTQPAVPNTFSLPGPSYA